MSAGSVVVVTGAAGALGGAVSRHLVAQGRRVIALDRPGSQDRLNALEKEAGGALLGLAADVTQASEWGWVMQHAAHTFDVPAGAVLSAGGWMGGTPLHAAADDGAWESMLRLNTETVYRALRALLPPMVAKQRGSIVIVGARAAAAPEQAAGAAAYAASKAAVVALAQAVASEVRAAHVRINAVLPSTIDTPANREAMPGADPRKWVSPDSLADVISFLLSDASRDVSGAAIPVYGQA